VAVLSVLKNDIELGDSDYSFNSINNKLSVSASLTSGDTIEIQYTYYSNYSTSEIENYVRSAIVYLSTNNYFDFEIEDSVIYPEPEVREQNLIASVTAILVNPPLQSLRLPDMTINYAQELNTADKISRAIAIFKKNIHGEFNVI